MNEPPYEQNVTLILCQGCGKKIGQSIAGGMLDLSKLQDMAADDNPIAAAFVEKFEEVTATGVVAKNYLCSTCGHLKSQHIYEEGACRPGFVCEHKCQRFRETPLNLPKNACVIKARVDSWEHPRILFGHPNPGEDTGMTFCRDLDGLPYKAEEIISFEVLWEDTNG